MAAAAMPLSRGQSSDSSPNAADQPAGPAAAEKNVKPNAATAAEKPLTALTIVMSYAMLLLEAVNQFDVNDTTTQKMLQSIIKMAPKSIIDPISALMNGVEKNKKGNLFKGIIKVSESDLDTYARFERTMESAAERIKSLKLSEEQDADVKFTDVVGIMTSNDLKRTIIQCLSKMGCSGPEAEDGQCRNSTNHQIWSKSQIRTNTFLGWLGPKQESRLSRSLIHCRDSRVSQIPNLIII